MQKVFTTDSLADIGGGEDSTKWLTTVQQQFGGQQFNYSECYFQTPSPSMSLLLALYLCYLCDEESTAK